MEDVKNVKDVKGDVSEVEKDRHKAQSSHKRFLEVILMFLT